MTAFYKILNNGYINGFGTNGADSATEIPEAEYVQIQTVFRERPNREGYSYLLREDLTWEEVEIPDPDVDEAEAFDIIFGGAE